MTIPNIALGSIGGEFRMMLYNEDGSLAKDTGWLKNRIVDNGLVQYGGPGTSDNTWWNWCCIGSSTTATTDGMTSLVSELATASGTDVSQVNNGGAPNYEFSLTRKYRFVAGVGTGTIGEMGMRGPSASTLFCRHVYSPTITKGATQVLDVYYKFTVYPAITENTGTAVIDGITYDWAASCYNLGNSLNAAIGTFERGGYPNTWSVYIKAYSGAKAGPLDTVPSGSLLGSTSGDGSAIVTLTGSGISEMEITFGLSVGNGTDYVRTVLYRTLATKIAHQCEFTQQAGQPNPGEGIPKDNTEELKTKVRFTWDRH